MASPWTKPTGRIALMTFAAIAEVFVVLAFLLAINDNFRRTAGQALNSAAVLIVGPRLVVEQTATQPTDQQTAAQPGQQQTTQPAQPQTATQPTEQPFSDEVTEGVNQLASGESKRGPGKVNLARAVIDGADLRGANLSGDADLTRAHLRGADLAGAYLSNADLVGVAPYHKYATRAVGAGGTKLSRRLRLA
jgi:hypothetical protein